MTRLITLIVLLAGSIAAVAQTITTCTVDRSNFDICGLCPGNISATGVLQGTFRFNLQKGVTFTFPSTCGTGENQRELSLGAATFEINTSINGNRTVALLSDFPIDPSATSFEVRATTASGNGSFVYNGTSYSRSQLPQATSEVRAAAAAAPIELLSWTATPQVANILLQWSSITEMDNDFYTIEYSEDGITFLELTRVAGSASSDQLLTYDYTHIAPGPGTHYYRLAQQDLDGSRTTFDVLAVKLDGQASTNALFPNPASAGQLITLSNITTADISLLRADGSLVARFPTPDREAPQFTLPAELPAGVYLVRQGALMSRLLVR
ncbi:hypothetical protein [Neolewinella sp.]|uniref:hypothetical protein n=1 Tax=Neolewinella sp. TaxID=2993543 RepID=UPI003B5253AB